MERAWATLMLLLGGCNWVFGLSTQTPPDAQPPGQWASITAGAAHLCGVDSDGRLWCWGDDRHDQLGIMSAATTTPRQVGDPATVWTAVGAGVVHTCGIGDGKVLCWGENTNGQAGGTASPVVMPMRVPFPPAAPTFTTVGAGDRHACALGENQIWCWGDPDVTTLSARAPGQITAASWRALAVGLDHTCAIAMDGQVWCWGSNKQGQVGAPVADKLMPSAVPDAANAIAIAAGQQVSCAVLGATASAAAGQVWCWGRNNGQTIDGGPDDMPRHPVQVVDGDDWTDVSIGITIACGRRGAMATCWGTASAGGLGDGAWSETIAPTTAVRAVPADAVAIGKGGDREENVCALANGNLACWGDNRGGQLGAPATLHLAPATIANPSAAKWRNVWVGAQHTCARDVDGGTWCWGADDVGQVTAQPSEADQPSPIAAPMTIADDAIAGRDYTCGRSGTTLECWGTNTGGELAVTDPTAHRSTRTLVGGGFLMGGSRATCYSNGNLDCWGTINGAIQSTPAPVGSFTNVYDAAFGDHASCALVPGNIRSCWGFNYQAEFGNGSFASGTSTATSPATVDGLNLSKISMTSRHMCGKAGDSHVLCWGTDYHSETGQGNPSPDGLTLVPFLVPNLVGCEVVSTSYDMSCAVCQNVVSCWGTNTNGKLGRGVDVGVEDLQPAPVALASETWLGVGTGTAHSCAISQEGSLACWGLGVRGQIGDGGHGSTVPVTIGVP